MRALKFGNPLVVGAVAISVTGLLRCSVEDKSGYRFADSHAGMGGNSGGSAAGLAGEAGESNPGGAAGQGGSGPSGASGEAGAAVGSGGSAGVSGEAGAGGIPPRGGAPSSGGSSGSGGAKNLGGSAGASGGATSFCGSNPLPTGVAAADYQCLDFEPALPDAALWKPASNPGDGMITLNTNRARSPTHSILSAVRGEAATGDDASLTFTAVGAAAITGVDVSIAINPVPPIGPGPPWSGWAELLCVRFGSGESCLSYTRGASLSPGEQYVGLLIAFQYSGGPAFAGQCALNADLKVNLWNVLRLKVDAASSLAEVWLDDKSLGTCEGEYLPDTAASVRIGVAASGGVDSGYNAYFDDARVVVLR